MRPEGLRLAFSSLRGPFRTMSSLFERDTKSLVKVLGRKGELVPVDSLTNALLLRPFCLVRKKRRRHPWPWDTPIIPTEYSLLDVLEPGTPEPEVTQSQPFHIQETGVGTGALEASSGLQRQLTTSNKASRNAKLAVQTLSVSPNTWEALVENRKVRVPQPSFLKNWEERENLYVVTEAVETVQDKTESTGQSGHPKVQGQVPTEKVLAIPQGSIMAYRVLRLVIKEDRWAVLHLPKGKFCGDTNRGSSSDRALDQQLGFGGLQKKLGAQLQDLATLSPELRLKLLGALQELLRTPKALQELEDSLEKALDKGVVEQLGGPGGLILSSLQDPAGSLPPSKNTAILCILGALVVLSDTQLDLLAQCLDRGLLPQLLELVVSILKVTFDLREEATFSLPSEALSTLPKEDAALALSLVESCGLELQGSVRPLTWDPDVLPQLSALYGALEGLKLLASPCAGAQQAQA